MTTPSTTQQSIIATVAAAAKQSRAHTMRSLVAMGYSRKDVKALIAAGHLFVFADDNTIRQVVAK